MGLRLKYNRFMRKLLTWAAITVCALLAVMMSTSPEGVPSIILIVPLLLIYLLLTLLSSLYFVTHMSVQKALRRGALIAVLPAFLLVLQSIGQLTVRDVSAVIILFLIGSFYFSRTSMRKR